MFIKLNKISSFILIFILLFCLMSPIKIYALDKDNLYVWSNNTVVDTADSIDKEVKQDTSPEKHGNFLGLTSQSAILMEQKTGTILYDHNSHEQLRPASITKIMTMLLIMEALDNGVIHLEDAVPCSEKASSMGGSQIWLDTRETLTVHEMLKAISIVSANDCSVAMAEFISGSEELFVEQMNKRAKELGMNDTCFKNCHGIDEDGHLTSAYDVALMSRELITKHPKIVEYTTIWMDTLRGGKSELVNTNKLVRNYDGITGLKTGSTSIALFNVSATATRNNLSLISVTMRGETSKIRFAEARKLLDYGFKNFEYIECAKKGDSLKEINVDKGIPSKVETIFETDAGYLTPKGKSKAIESTISVPNIVSAPIIKEQKIGEISYSLDGKVISTVNLIAKEEVKKLNLLNMSSRVIKNWFELLR